MPFRCERCAAVIDGSWRWCPECGAIPPQHDLVDLSGEDDLDECLVGTSNLFQPHNIRIKREPAQARRT